MILTKLTLNDFGVFQGQHTVDLSPSKRRPIILFGGKNGAGKSTILEALRLCLYGAGALGIGISKQDYAKFLESRIHTNPNALIQPTFASIQVEFHYGQTDGLAAYAVTRSWERGSTKKITESLLIERDGKPVEEVETEHWQDFIRELIPPGVSQLFFFDGEKIQQLAEDTTDQQALGDAIKSLLGVDIIESLQADLRLQLTRLAKAGRNKAEISQIRDLEKRIQHLKGGLASAKEQRATQDLGIRQIKEDLARAEGVFSAQGGAFARNRDNLLHQEGALKERIAQIEERLRQQCAGLLPFALVPDLCLSLRRQLLLEQESARSQAGKVVLRSAKDELMGRLHPSVLLAGVSDVSEKTKQEVHTRIIRALRKPFRVEESEPVECRHFASQATSSLLMSWIEQATHDVPAKLKAISAELEKAHRDLHKISAAVRKMPTEETLKPILEEIQKLNENLIKANTEALLGDQRIKELELGLAECERRYAQLAEKLAAAAKHSERLNLLPRLQDALGEYRQALIAKKVAQLQGAVTACFNMLSRKKDSLRQIRIDPGNFSISLLDRQGRPLPKAQLSAGEKQIYAISMLWALGRTSGRPLPVVIDTPLARLDSDHRKLLVENYFPNASHQVILLSTDTEVDQRYFEALRPAAARAYCLEYEQVASCSGIRKGYFWRERNEAHQVTAN